MHNNEKPVVLYIEDNADNRKLIKKLLQVSGYAVHTAKDGLTGLSLLDQARPDLILMDIGMPVLDGYTLTARIRERPEYAQIPIVAVTAHVMQVDEEKTRTAGCTGFIQKPIDVDRFPDQVRSYLNESNFHPG